MPECVALDPRVDDFTPVLEVYDLADPRDQPRTATPYLGDAADPDSRAEWWLLRDEDASVAVGSVQVPVNSDAPAFCWVATVPGARRRGHGRTMADHLWSRVKDIGGNDRRALSMSAARGGEAASVRAFAAACGYVVSDAYGVWVLDLATTAATAATPGYDLQVLTGGCPEGLLRQRADLQERFSRDVPSRTLDHSETWTVDRMRASFDRDDTARVFEVLALASGGEVAGFTRLLVRDDAQAEQKDTFVSREHRGHGLGLAMKAHLVGALPRLAPHVTRIRTFVEADNAPMRQINTALGYRLDRESTEFLRPL